MFIVAYNTQKLQFDTPVYNAHMYYCVIYADI
jgi:hypothetical protein